MYNEAMPLDKNPCPIGEKFKILCLHYYILSWSVSNKTYFGILQPIKITDQFNNTHFLKCSSVKLKIE